MGKWFGTDGIRGRVGEPQLAPDFIVRLGHAAGRVLMRAHSGTRRPTVLIGKDTRVSGYLIESALEAGFASAGVDVLLTGPLPTPAVAYLVRALRLDAGVVVSASHNPYPDNGIKFFAADGSKLSDALENEIEAALEEPLACVSTEQLGKARRVDDAVGRYIEFCKSTFPADLTLDGLRLVVDAAHGAGYVAAPAVFYELGAQVFAVAVNPDGFNINAGVGATHPEHLAAAVKAHGADLGIALDGDGDRVVMVDASGRVYDGDALLYVIAKSRLAAGERVPGVVGTVMSNLGLQQALQELGIAFERTPVGDRYVAERLRALGWTLGGENSGHLLCLEKHTTGDGLISALQVLAALLRAQQTLAEATAPLRFYPQQLQNVPWTRKRRWQDEPTIVAAKNEVEARLTGRGRVLIRPSGTEPLLRLMVEADDEALVVSALQRLKAAVNAALSASE